MPLETLGRYRIVGQLGRGDSVPEFARALFGREALGVLPELVDTRYGFHVVLVARRIAGRQLPYEAVAEAIAAVTNPWKINYECLGNVEPHVHWPCEIQEALHDGIEPVDLLVQNTHSLFCAAV